MGSLDDLLVHANEYYTAKDDGFIVRIRAPNFELLRRLIWSNWQRHPLDTNSVRDTEPVPDNR